MAVTDGPMSKVGRILCLIAETDHLSLVRAFSPVRAQSVSKMNHSFVERTQKTVLFGEGFDFQ